MATPPHPLKLTVHLSQILKSRPLHWQINLPSSVVIPCRGSLCPVLRRSPKVSGKSSLSYTAPCFGKPTTGLTRFRSSPGPAPQLSLSPGPALPAAAPGLPSCQSIAPARTTATGECACCCNSSGSLGSRSGSLSWKSELEPLLDLCIQRRVQDSGPQALLRSGRTTSTTRQPLIRDGRAS